MSFGFWRHVVEAPPPAAWLLALTAWPVTPVFSGADTDLALMRRLLDRDAEALAALYDRHAGAVFAVCLRILRDADAEEVLSEVFWELWERPHRFDPSRGTPIAFLVVLARSRAVDRIRTAGRRGRILDDGEDDVREAIHGESNDDPFDSAADSQLRRHVAAALAALDTKQRRAIELAYYGALTHSEIAATLGAPLGTVKSWIRQGLVRLREALGERYGEGARA